MGQIRKRKLEALEEKILLHLIHILKPGPLSFLRTLVE